MSNNLYTVRGNDNFVFRTKFNFSNWIGCNIKFAQDATGQVLIILDRGRLKIHNGHPITITLREDLPNSEEYTMELYSGEDWFNPSVNEYYNWYYKVRPDKLIIVDENNFKITFCSTDDSDVQTPALLINIGPIHPDDDMSDDEKEIQKELNELGEGEREVEFNQAVKESIKELDDNLR